MSQLQFDVSILSGTFITPDANPWFAPRSSFPFVTALLHQPKRSSLLSRPTADVPVGLSWLVGITASFLAVGVIGVITNSIPSVTLRAFAEEEAPVVLPDISMASLELTNSIETPADSPAEQTDMPLLPEVTAPPPQVTNVDIPEPVDALTEEDIFSVPAAPVVIAMEDVAQPRPKTTPTPPRTTRTPTTSQRQSSSSTSSSGGGGTSMSASARGGRFPAPPYPSFAKSARMQGTVRLRLSVGAGGNVESATVLSGTGFSVLDEYAANWVRRNWRFKAGPVASYTLPLSFKLK